MKSFNEWVKLKEAYENPPSPYIGRDKNKPPRVKPRRLTPEERKELHKKRRISDYGDYLGFQSQKKRIEDENAY
jgi:hypothetical protein